MCCWYEKGSTGTFLFFTNLYYSIICTKNHVKHGVIPILFMHCMSYSGQHAQAKFKPICYHLGMNLKVSMRAWIVALGAARTRLEYRIYIKIIFLKLMYYDIVTISEVLYLAAKFA